MTIINILHRKAFISLNYLTRANLLRYASSQPVFRSQAFTCFERKTLWLSSQPSQSGPAYQIYGFRTATAADPNVSMASQALPLRPFALQLTRPGQYGYPGQKSGAARTSAYVALVLLI